MRIAISSYSILLCSLSSVQANVEKTIFITPSSIHAPQEHPNLEDLRLDALSPLHWSLRREIIASFPTAARSRGTETWLLLKKLEEQRRYEVRICWAATQPTSFTLDTFELDEVFSNTDFISSLAAYSEQRQSTVPDRKERVSESHHLSALPPAPEGVRFTTLFLRISAAADYFSTNLTLMQNVPPVSVDIILDPYILNALPRSLLPTAGYLLLIAIGAWFLSDYIWLYLHQFAQPNKQPIIPRDPPVTGSQAKKDL